MLIVSVTSVTPVSGTRYYSGKQQEFDVLGKNYTDVPAPMDFGPDGPYLVEINNELVPIIPCFVAAYHKGMDADDGNQIWEFQKTGDAIACGLARDEQGAISVDVMGLAGKGLSVISISGISFTSCTALEVNIGCGLFFDENNALQLDYESLAGGGLSTVSLASCTALEVNIGCGLTFDEDDALTLDYESLAGDGLTTVSLASCTALAIIEPLISVTVVTNVTCVNGTLSVDYATISFRGSVS